jgi:hypothetical protein
MFQVAVVPEAAMTATRREKKVPGAPHSTHTADWINTPLDERELMAWRGLANSVR